MAASDYITNPQITGPGINMAADLYKMISGIPDAYQEGVEQRFKRGQMARTEELQKPYLDESGRPLTDFDKVQAEMARRGLPPDLALLWKQKFLSEDAGTPGMSPYGATPQARPSSPTEPYYPPERRTMDAPAAPQLGEEPPEGTVNPRRIGNQAQNLTGSKILDGGQAPTVRRLAEANGIDPEVPEFANEFRGIGLDRQLEGTQVDGVQAKIDRLKNDKNLQQAGLFGPTPDATALVPNRVRTVPGSQAPPLRTAQAPAAAQAQLGGAAAMVPPGVDPRIYAQGFKQAAVAERAKARREGIAGIPSKAREDTAASYDKYADAILSEYAKANELTPAQKEYHGAKLPGESLTEFEARRASEKAGAADAEKEVSKFRTAGIDAIGHKAMLDAIGKLGEKVGYGVIPKIQSELGKLGIETKGLSDIQAYERAIDYMAPRLRPEGQGKLLGTELTAFKASLGGLMTTPEGRKISIDNLKLLADYEEGIGRVANRDDMTTRRKMQAIYNLPPPHLKSIADVPSSAAAAPQKVTDKKTYDALPRGHVFVDENGKTWRKP